jgi:acylphosphatase
MNKRLHLIIHGRVQMVAFRYSTRRKAHSLGITGWVRNNSDGTVEAIFESSEEKLKEILEYCHKGPLFAKVTNLEEKWEEYKNEFDKFEIRY